MNMEEMKVNALLMNSTDNVVTTVTEIAKGENVCFMEGSECVILKAMEDIPYCHKVALSDLTVGSEVVKYGESLGRLVCDVAKGGWKTFQFWGYRRAEGRPGIRNHILILPTCVCASESCRVVASQIRGAVNIVFNTGCSDVQANTDMSQKVLTGFACHPNVYGVVIIGLGCETVPHRKLKEKIERLTSKPVVSFGIQEEGGTLKTIEKATRAAREMAQQAGSQQKELFDSSELYIGIECGGSDATSGIASNPSVGEMSDILVDMGATTVMSESIEWIGGEHILAKRAATTEIHNQIIEVCREYEAHLSAAGQDCRAGQPTPGNKAGGLSTLEEKSLGCIRKGGTRPIVEVLQQAVRPSRKGAVVMDTAGFDIASVTSMVASGCQAIVFTTGRGTPTGNAIAPVLKVTANERTYRMMEDKTSAPC